MDANKLAKLRESGFVIRECCTLCRGFRCPGRRGASWGTCVKHPYQHGKHTGELRECSVSPCGWCPSFELSEEQVAQILGTYVCLMER